jgi:hypothetical protein
VAALIQADARPLKKFSVDTQRPTLRDPYLLKAQAQSPEAPGRPPPFYWGTSKESCASQRQFTWQIQNCLNTHNIIAVAITQRRTRQR